MRLTKYLRSDGESWMLLKIRCSSHVSYERLNDLMHKNGWVRWSELSAQFIRLKKQIAKSDPVKYPNWKEVKIPMTAAKKSDLPAPLKEEQDQKVIEVIG